MHEATNRLRIASLGFVAAALCFGLAQSGGLAGFEASLTDLRFGLERYRPGNDIVIVDMAERTDAPVSRGDVARTVDRLGALGASHIAIDLELPAPVAEAGGDALGESLQRFGADRIAVVADRPLAEGGSAYLAGTIPSDATLVARSQRGSQLDNERSYSPFAVAGGTTIPSLAVWLAHQAGEGLAPSSPFRLPLVDGAAAYGILSLDLLNERPELANRLAGKPVVIADLPSYWRDLSKGGIGAASPPAVLSVAAAQALVDGAELYPVSGFGVHLSAAILAGLMFIALLGRSPAWALCWVVAAAALTGAALLFLQSVFRLEVEVAPFALALLMAIWAQLLASLLSLAAERQAASEAASQRQALVAHLVDNAADGMVLFDSAGWLLACNASARRLSGNSGELEPATTLADLMPADADRLTAALNNCRPEVVTSTIDDAALGRLTVERRLERIELGDGSAAGLLTLRDVTLARTQSAAMLHLARHDPLTGLANRNAFRTTLTRALQERNGQPIACLFIDLERFKDVNDSLGHAFGDRLLESVASRLRALVAHPDQVARLGGDEFAVLAVRSKHAGDPRSFAARIVRALEEPFVEHGHTIQIGARIGIASCPDDAGDGESLLRFADQALVEAKRRRRSVVAFEPLLEHKADSRRRLIQDLREAVENGALRLDYQPKIDLANDRLASVEGLMRLDDPELAHVSPTEFIPLAEETGLIDAMTLQIVDLAIADQRAWRKGGLQVTTAINLSACSLRSEAFIDALLKRCSETKGHDKPLISFELTESALMTSDEADATSLSRLAEAGFSIALDDFGTGYSSFAYLGRLPIDTLKIDRAFVQGCEGSEVAAEVLRGMVGMAHRLGLRTVAEGIESRTAFDFLRSIGCDEGQGFILGRPMDGERLLDWVQSRHAQGGAVEAPAEVRLPALLPAPALG